jgi:hypothetical protein
MVQSPIGSISLAGGIDQSEVSGLSGSQEILFECDSNLFSKSSSDEPAGGDGIPISNDSDGLFG